MKRTIKITLILAIVALVASPVFAQPKHGDRGRNAERGMMRDVSPEVRSEAHVAVFDEYLELTETQEEQIKAADAEFAQKGAELREEKINRRKKMTMARELRSEHQKAIHEILTKEQYAVYLEKKEAIQYDIRQRLKDHAKDGN
ncbi:MAG: hypothetical protein JJ971_05930 [Balneolaceae bacterium]|nr:hypothetical protein [Balneolaceae bacterium]MBO6545917.1 hypothetical protein [Balneolaceae bacterium]MBO6647313.1 hypothetical protein [Balneolaceae bacterium]